MKYVLGQKITQLGCEPKNQFLLKGELELSVLIYIYPVLNFFSGIKIHALIFLSVFLSQAIDPAGPGKKLLVVC